MNNLKVLFQVVAAATLLILQTACGFSANSSATPGNRLERTEDLRSVITPDSIPSQIKDYQGFRVSFNCRNHTPNWVAWEVNAQRTDGPEKRYNKFWKDNTIIGCPVTEDYKNSGYDRGHMCPSAENKSSASLMKECFVLANICPQSHDLNNGAWKTLETTEREWAIRDGIIYIVAGPVYKNNSDTRIGDTGVRVPAAFFKVLIAPNLQNPRGIGFIYPNMRAAGNMANYSMTIDEVEKVTGLDFFHNLPDDLENEIESKTSFKEWE